MEKHIRLSFSNRQKASAIRVRSSMDLSFALGELGLHTPRPILVIVGGASKVSHEDLARLRLLFVKVLAPVAETLGAYVVDGGTDSGVMQLIGQARTQIGATFPLIGVAPVGKVVFPHQTLTSEGTLLEPHHTHFVLVPGATWGDESSWIARVASVLAQRNPSVTVLINGGEIALKDVSESVKAGRSVLVIAGSGRAADTLAVALRGEATDERVRKLAASKLVRAIDLTESFDNLTHAIKEMLCAKK